MALALKFVSGRFQTIIADYQFASYTENQMRELTEDYVRFLEQFPMELLQRNAVAAYSRAVDWMRKAQAESPAAVEPYSEEIRELMDNFQTKVPRLSLSRMKWLTFKFSLRMPFPTRRSSCDVIRGSRNFWIP